MLEYPEYITCPHCGSAIKQSGGSTIVEDGKLASLYFQLKSDGVDYKLLAEFTKGNQIVTSFEDRAVNVLDLIRYDKNV